VAGEDASFAKSRYERVNRSRLPHRFAKRRPRRGDGFRLGWLGHGGTYVAGYAKKRRSQQRRRDSAFGDQPRLRLDRYRPFDLGWRYASPSFVRRSDALLAASAEWYVVKPSAEGRKRLEALIHAGKSSAQMLTRAHPAQGRRFGGGQRLDRQHNLGGVCTSVDNVARSRQQLVAEGFEATLNRKDNPNSVRPRIFDGRRRRN
jgi:hypothetical protein